MTNCDSKIFLVLYSIILNFCIFQGLQFGNYSDICVFAKLTNSYCLAAIQDSTDFYSASESENGYVIPIVHTSIGGTQIIGRWLRVSTLPPISTMTIKHLDLRQPTWPPLCTLSHNWLGASAPPEFPTPRRGYPTWEERLSALGNVIACNDRVALVHPDVDRETEEIIADVLKVEVFRQMIADKLIPRSQTCTPAGTHTGPGRIKQLVGKYHWSWVSRFESKNYLACLICC